MKKIKGTAEAWESGELGCSEEHVVKSDINIGALDEALELKLISIRMQTTLIDDLKDVAKMRGLGYQPLIKQVLRRFVDAEKKQLLKEAAARAEMMDQPDREEPAESPKAQCA
ncbi:hypothetical protein [Pontibacterium sp.]|uniref:hypothetical protein n=1 Tax=Pontibacterium sp. TaxID=2036026 RepID=UPI003568FE09